MISLTWRLYNSPQSLQTLLNQHGFTGTIIGCTPDISSQTRSREIESWLEGNPVESFVILDDEKIEGFGLRQVWTDIGSGLLDSHVDQAISILNNLL